MDERYNTCSLRNALCVAAVYLMEDLLFQMDETSVLPVDYRSEALAYYFGLNNSKFSELFPDEAGIE
jgi:hypothetical protein